jgi:aromatic ring-opening dioxygenase catalytic subunit (LigB family)
MRLPTYFLSHGGGPWPWLKDDQRGAYDALEASLHAVRRELGDAPRAVLMISGHWEASRFLVSSAAQPPMIFDYHGFPEHTYRIRYDAPGDPVLAERVHRLLAEGDVPSGLDPRRGFDHGTFSLMHTLYPEATLPVVQLSLRADFDPAMHLRVGELLAPLRDDGVLIVGSGLSFHDLRHFMNGRGGAASATFDRWLGDVLVDAPPAARNAQLLRWADAPAARAAHPREDHLLPLMVAVGAAGEDPGTRIYHQNDFMGAITVSSFRFGMPLA